MAALVRDSTHDPVVAELAFQLFESCECHRCLNCVVDFIDIWTRAHFIYVSDGEEMEIVNTPLYDIQRIVDHGSFEGDCDDAAVFVASMFKTLGMETRFVAIKTDPYQNFSHVFVETYAGNRWMIVDPTAPVGTVHQHYGRMVQYA